MWPSRWIRSLHHAPLSCGMLPPKGCFPSSGASCPCCLLRSRTSLPAEAKVRRGCRTQWSPQDSESVGTPKLYMWVYTQHSDQYLSSFLEFPRLREVKASQAELNYCASQRAPGSRQQVGSPKVRLPLWSREQPLLQRCSPETGQHWDADRASEPGQ